MEENVNEIMIEREETEIKINSIFLYSFTLLFYCLQYYSYFIIHTSKPWYKNYK